ncbi:MAG: fibronectin type III domain-containing protein, partial [Gammaproteobacteria bacterium]|nr:fibronectin type III domain-containing protein [Gammaproteobacteria bacterium]
MLACIAVWLALPSGGAVSAVSPPCAEEQSEPVTHDGVLWWLLRRPSWRAPPGRPAPPHVVEATADSLTVTWAPPADGGPLPTTGYDVEYRAAGDVDYVAWPHVGEALEARIAGLIEVTAYEIRVRAANELGAGDWSLPGTGTT